MSTRAEVYAVIDGERDYQIAMAEKAHGDPSSDFYKSLENFECYIRSYSNQLNDQLARTWGPEAYSAALDTVRKIAALAVAAMEIHGAVPRIAPTKHAKGTDLTGG